VGGGKASLELLGRPLVSYPLEALSAVLEEVAVVAKRDTALPELAGARVWREPDEPRHPLAGVAHALRCASGRDVVVCAVDLPLVRDHDVRMLAAADPGAAGAVLARGPRGQPEPVLGRYAAGSLGAIERAAAEGIPARTAAERLGARTVALTNPDALFNLNVPDDVERAAALLRGRGR
jgi:molybdopterin-guanine dinucleotide biosynthesis protein A